MKRFKFLGKFIVWSDNIYQIISISILMVDVCSNKLLLIIYLIFHFIYYLQCNLYFVYLGLSAMVAFMGNPISKPIFDLLFYNKGVKRFNNKETNI